MSNNHFNQRGQGLVEFVIILAIIAAIIIIAGPAVASIFEGAGDKIETAKAATDNGAVQGFLQALGGK
jgi:Tfp pilus assembly protein FimT